MTLEDFEKELKAHDWYYEMTEDNGVYKHGLANYNHLVELSKKSPEHLLLFNKYKKEHSL